MKRVYDQVLRPAGLDVWLVGLPVVVTALLWATSPYPLVPWAGLAALGLLCLPWWAYRNWQQRSSVLFPILALVGFVYWVYYAPPLFWGDRDVPGVVYVGEGLSEDAMAQGVLLAFLGVACLWIGSMLGIGRRVRFGYAAEVRSKPSSWTYLRLLLLIGALLNLREGSAYLLGDAGRQVLIAFATTVPLVAFALLFRRLLRGQASTIDKVWLAAYASVRVLAGLASGWLGDVPYLILCTGVIYIGERRRIPMAIVAGIAVVVLFFQPAKDAWRKQFWYGDDTQASQSERIGGWFQAAVDEWQQALSSTDGAGLRVLAYRTMSRVNLLTQTANVLEMTPAVVPHQGGDMYSYMLVTWVPRAIWPEKPSINESNRLYQVAYGLTREQDLDRVSIAVGSLTEGYIAFGWPGAVLVMLLLGVLFDVVQQMFLRPRSGSFLIAVGISLTLSFVNVEAQAAQYLGGLFQNVLLLMLVFFPVVRLRLIGPLREDVQSTAAVRTRAGVDAPAQLGV